MLSCQKENQHPIFEIVDKNHTLLNKVLEEAEKYEVQIIYTQVHRDQKGDPKFRSLSYNYDSLKYFYPASTVKMPVAFLALEKVNELNEVHGLDLDENTTIHHEASRHPQSAAITDSTHHSFKPTIGHYIDKLFVVSDNDAYNRLYEFLGQDYINDKLKEKGIFTDSRIVHRVGIGGFSTEDHKYTNAIKFVTETDEELLSLPPQKAEKNHFNTLEKTQKGKGYVDTSGQTIMEPFDMSKKNFINLKDLERSLVRFVFPDVYSEKERYQLTPEQYDRVRESMLYLPRDFEYLEQDTSYDYYDGYVKFFMYGDTKEDIPDHVKIMNKVGFAYGYLTDCAYIQDLENDIEFFLTATIHVNENQIYNDGVYEYDDIGIPFLAELGRQVYWYELNREN